MQKNSFVNPNATWKPPDETPNPYRQANFEQTESDTPYIISAPNEVNEVAGKFIVKLNGNFATSALR